MTPRAAARCAADRRQRGAQLMGGVGTNRRSRSSEAPCRKRLFDLPRHDVEGRAEPSTSLSSYWPAHGGEVASAMAPAVSVMSSSVAALGEPVHRTSPPHHRHDDAEAMSSIRSSDRGWLRSGPPETAVITTPWGTATASARYPRRSGRRRQVEGVRVGAVTPVGSPRRCGSRAQPGRAGG